jgi:hypothetical protein
MDESLPVNFDIQDSRLLDETRPLPVCRRALLIEPMVRISLTVSSRSNDAREHRLTVITFPEHTNSASTNNMIDTLSDRFWHAASKFASFTSSISSVLVSPWHMPSGNKAKSSSTSSSQRRSSKEFMKSRGYHDSFSRADEMYGKDPDHPNEGILLVDEKLDGVTLFDNDHDDVSLPEDASLD